MKNLFFGLIIVSGCLNVSAEKQTKTEASLSPLPDPTPPMILDRLGDYRREVVTESEEARRWYDQGMALMLGYNFDGAISSFREATRIDPGFAMAWWGIGYSGGPNQNNPGIDKPKDQWSYEATQQAFTHRERENGANRALIEALVHRYQWPVPEDLTEQNEAYLSQMNKVMKNIQKSTLQKMDV